MSRRSLPALAPIVIGPILGIIAALTIIDTNPAVLGWLFGIGIGLMGGAFIAALVSGEALIAGPSAGRTRGRERAAVPWLEHEAPDDEA